MMHQQFFVIRTIDPLAPASAIGYDIANCVALLFDHIRHEHGDPARADLDTLRVQQTGGAIKASVYVRTDFIPGVDRFNLTP
jgi:hypothetical protein